MPSAAARLLPVRGEKSISTSCPPNMVRSPTNSTISGNYWKSVLVKLFRGTALCIPQLNRIIFVNNSFDFSKGSVSPLVPSAALGLSALARKTCRSRARLIGGKLTSKNGGNAGFLPCYFPFRSTAPSYDKVKNNPGWTVHTLPCTTFMQLEMPDLAPYLA